MVRKMNLDGTTRRALVATIEELTGEKAVYRRMPICNYGIGEITVLKDGSIEFPDGSDITSGLRTRDLRQSRSRRNFQTRYPSRSRKQSLAR